MFNKIYTIITIHLILFSPAIAQELNIGGGIGTDLKYANELFFLDGIIEYRPGNSLFSVLSGPQLIIASNKVILSAPLELRFIFGKQIRIGPSFGIIIRSNSNFGWTGNIICEYKTNKDLFFFLKGSCDRESYKDETARGDEIRSTVGVFWLSLGVKKNLVFKSVPDT